jgi:transcriptional regulator with XRE-family HTH domain
MSPYPDDHPVHVARKEKGWRLEDLGSRTGCSKPMLSNVERGYIPPARSRLKIAKALETTPEQLWPDETMWPDA